MFGIESRPVGIYNFDYFSIDMAEGYYRMGSKEYPLGAACCAVANLSKETKETLLRLGAALNTVRCQLLLLDGYDRELFQKGEEHILSILSYIQKTEPFSFFDIDYSAQIVRDAFSPKPFDKLEAMLHLPEEERSMDELDAVANKAHKNYTLACELIRVYCYLVNDAVNFSALIQNFTANLMCDGSRRKEILAKYAYGFCSSEEVKQAMASYNYNKDLDGVNLRPRVTQVPVILWDEENNKPYIVRRLYFGRLMDFWVAEWFEGLMQGHYLWKCGVCGDYFLLTNARRQLYCGKYNPVYGTSCDHVANNRRLGKEKGLSPQKKEDNPIWQLWHKRYASIRKNKSLDKYSDAVSDEAKRILDSYYERAQIDAKYAQGQYEADIALTNLYAQAKKRIKK